MPTTDRNRNKGAAHHAPPLRLSVLIARAARKAVILARGPAGRTRAINWSLTTDSTDIGPSARARIYERKCDISPNGAWLLYAAFGHGPDLPGGGAFTAISPPPALTALTFIRAGTTYGGGGLFLSDRRVWIPGADCAEALRMDRRFTLAERPELDLPPPALHELSFSTIHYRLLRDGWRMTGPDYEKTSGGRRLVKSFPERGEAHLLVDERTGAAEDCGDWEWADFDGADLLYAQAGRIWRRGVKGSARLVLDTRPASA